MKNELILLPVLKGGGAIQIIRTASGKEYAHFFADMDIDCDGAGGNPCGDRCFQPDTTLHDPDGQPLVAEKVPFVVVPPIICQRTSGKVLGALCHIQNLSNGRRAETVVGDIGPTTKDGEGSPAAAELVGLDGNPNYGGTSDAIIEYFIEVNVAAFIGGIQYQLKSYG